MSKNIDINAIKALFFQSVRLKSHESCLILTDTEMIEVARPFYDYVKNIIDDASFHIMQPTNKHGDEPEPEAAKLLKENDISIMITKYSLSHTKARRNATENGARIVSMPGILIETINRCIDIDYDELHDTNMKLHETLYDSKKVKVTTDLGTDMEFKVRHVMGRNGGYRDKPGMWGNLPAGEIPSGIINANGKLVIDGSFPGLGKLESPLTIEVKDNYAVKIEGERSDEVKKMLDSEGPNAYLLAEFGVGTNPKATITGSILEDEKVLGTVHFALGNDISYGGTNKVSIHVDGVIKEPNVFVDDKQIMKKGKLLI
ncbi:leucyl aminopeptidase [Candidatus Woesearchaeota archaeon]|nr:MAG: leucyl aminopeptidase [Candidatus Woesearchaeota archaeon]